jgi:hypothetical protein
VDLVGIKPTTSPATPGRAPVQPSRHRSTLESSDVISSSSTGALAVEPRTTLELFLVN